MRYSGKLYGKVDNSYFPLLETSDDIESLKEKLKVADEIIKNIHLEPTMNGSKFQPNCGYKKWNELFEQYFSSEIPTEKRE